MPTRLEDVPEELIVDFDINDHTLADVVHERLAQIRAAHPVAYSTAHGGYWVVTEYKLVHELLRDWEAFTSAESAIPPSPVRPLPLEYDPPEHTEYRRALNALFSPPRMKALEGDIRASATRLLDTFAADGRCEFVSAFAHPLPTAIFLSLMGWPLEDAPRFAEWNYEIVLGKPGGTEEENFAARIAACAAVWEYFTEMLEHRRRDPDVDDVTGLLLKAEYRGERPLRDDEVLAALWLLMVGGLHTTRGVLSFGMIHLAQNPDQRQRIIDDPSLIPGAVEELLRLDAPVAPLRVLAKPVTLGGVQLQEGDRVLAVLCAANRDGAEFDCPADVRVDRPGNRHLTFGAGPHRCVGSHLARLELAIAFEEIHRRIPDYRLVPGRPPSRHHTQIRGVHDLWLEFTPESR